MLEILLHNITFHITCSTLYFAMYVLNCYVFKNKKARLPYKIMLTGLLPFLNIASALMQLCFIIPSFKSSLSRMILSMKIDKAISELGYNKKTNSNTNRVPKKA